MNNIGDSISYYIGLSLAQNNAHSSSVCVLSKQGEIVYLDKLYFNDDIKLFFENSPYAKNCAVMIPLLKDESLLEGKWRVHSKGYKCINEIFTVNKNNWTNRLNDRLCDFFLELKNKNTPVLRCNINLLRQSYGLKSDYLENTSLDCKNFQSGLRLKMGFNSLPENILPSSSLDAILSAKFLLDLMNKKVECREILEFGKIKVVNKI